ncbi:MAG: hypothetical protein E6902_14450 [Paeniclostridium sordellii]|nr:hypothetical protein [Paeniclostridium sordellii]
MEIINKIDLITLIPIIISLISLIISLITSLRTWRSEKFKLDFDMVKWFGNSRGGNPIFLWLYITNNSKLPCSILEVKIKNNRMGYIVEGSGTGSKKLISTIRSDTKKPRDIYSLSYPINIDPYSSIGGYFHITSKNGFHLFEEDFVDVTIKTNRGSITKKIFMDFGKNIFRVLQYKTGEIKIMKRSDGSEIEYLIDKDID